MTPSDVIIADHAGVNAVEEGLEVGATSGYYAEGLNYGDEKGEGPGEKGVFCAGIDDDELGY